MALRVLIVVTTLRPQSGWGTYGRNTVLGLQNRGHTVYALVNEISDEDLCEQDARLPDPLSLYSSPIAWVKTSMALRRAVRRFRPDIIHVLVEPYALAISFSRLTVRTPWVLSLNGTYSVLPLYNWHTRPLLRSAYLSANHILSPSNYTAKRTLEAVAEKCGDKVADKVRKKLSRFKLGIEQSSPQQTQKDGDEKQILYVGGIKPRKGIAEIIEGCAIFHKKNDLPFHLHLVGTYPDDSYRKQLQTLVDKHALQDHITFHGHIDEEALDTLYAKADLFIMLSKSHGHHFEGFGLVFLEANIRGIPVIGPKDSGCEDAIREGVTGFSVDHNNPDMVANRMEQILGKHQINPDDCRAWAKEHSVEQQVITFEETYEKVIPTTE